MSDWKVAGDGVWSLIIHQGLLCLRVVKSGDSFWPQINGVVSRRGYSRMDEAQQMAITGAKKLVAQLIEQMEKI